MKILSSFALLSLIAPSCADLRLASQPKTGFKVRNRGGAEKFVVNLATYDEPSTFGYAGLEKQKRNNYDNFLRSNIDNEQDNRNFVTEAGKDHLPFRTNEGIVERSYVRNGVTTNITQTVEVDTATVIPLRWNNPHSSELEVNIWIMTPNTDPYVVPIKKPTCSGEGYQDGAFDFTIPKSFLDLGAKVPNFKGCHEGSGSECVLQFYSHSVESRTYSIGLPLYVKGPGNTKHDESKVCGGTGANKCDVKPFQKDPWMDLSKLRDLCLPATAAESNIGPALEVREARLLSDQFNHAYQDSNFSPYQGQQFNSISKNLQASAIIKAVAGNRGELGKDALTNKAKQEVARMNRAQNLQYRTAEAAANRIIRSMENAAANKNTGKVAAQKLNTCFRCNEAASVNTKRLQTTTYIPSFQLEVGSEQLANANAIIEKSKAGTRREADKLRYDGIVDETGKVQIYYQTLQFLKPYMDKAAAKGIIYQPAVEKKKGQIGTMDDSEGFKKVRATPGGPRNGRQAATTAYMKMAKDIPGTAGASCPKVCLLGNCNLGEQSVLRPAVLAHAQRGNRINTVCVGYCDVKLSAEDEAKTDFAANANLESKTCSANAPAQAEGTTDCTGCDWLYRNDRPNLSASIQSTGASGEDGEDADLAALSAGVQDMAEDGKDECGENDADPTAGCNTSMESSASTVASSWIVLGALMFVGRM